MNKKLNYVFSRVLDDYKTAYKENGPAYVGFGVLYILFNIGIAMLTYFMDLGIMNSLTYLPTDVAYTYTYVLLLFLPCLANLKKEEGGTAIRILPVLGQHLGSLVILVLLSLGGFFLLGTYANLLQEEGFWTTIDALMSVFGNVLTVFFLLFLLRSAIQNRISFFELLAESVVVTIVCMGFIREFYYFVKYGLMESFSFVFQIDIGEIVLVPILFITVNMILSPLLVCIVTAFVEYKQPVNESL